MRTFSKMAERAGQVKRTLVTADLHLSDQPVNAYRLDFVEHQLPKIVEHRAAERLIIAGDLTQQKDHHSAWLTHHTVELLARLADQVEVIVIEGNHDFLDIDYPFFRFLEKINSEHKIRWIRKPTVLDGMLLLPHTSQYEQDWAKLPARTWPDTQPRLIVTHNTFDGATSERGGKLKGIPLSALPKLPIISGDVHQPQEMGRLTYVGPPYTVYFGDEFKPRVLLINERGGIVSFDTNAPRKRLLELTYPWKDRDLSGLRKGDIVKARISIGSQDGARWNEIRDDAKSAIAGKGCQIFAVHPVALPMNSRRMLDARSHHMKSDEQLIKEYCSRRNADKKTTAAGLAFATSAVETETARSATANRRTV